MSKADERRAARYLVKSINGALECVTEVMQSKDSKPGERLRAAEMLLDRALGKNFVAVEEKSGAGNCVLIINGRKEKPFQKNAVTEEEGSL